VLLVLCGALFLDALDVSMIGVALPSIRSDLGMSTSSLQWVVSAYVLGFGGFLLLGGRAADLLGRRRMFLLSLAVFLVASAVGGLSQALDPDPQPLRQGRQRSVHRTGRTVDHHDVVRRGDAQQGPGDLHRDRCDRLLAGPRHRRRADRDRLALDPALPVVVALATLLAAIGSSRPTSPRLAAGAPSMSRARSPSPPGCCWRCSHSSQLPQRDGCRLNLASVIAPAQSDPFVAIERRIASPLVRLDILRSGRCSAPTSQRCRCSGVGRLPVRRHPLHAAAARWSTLETGLAIFPGVIVVALAPRIGSLVERFARPR
jgi:hypothetical protein